MVTLLAGAARCRLDPPVGVAMVGYSARQGVSTGVHDDLAVQALVLSDGRHKVAIAGVDLLALGVRIADRVADAVAAASDIPAEAVLISATHTHSGPLFNIFATPRPDARIGPERNLEWELALPEKIARTILAANDGLEPASLKAAGGCFTLGTNRRLERPDGTTMLAANYSGVADPEVKIMGIYRTDRSPIAFVMNYPCHGVVLCEDNLLFSRDWMGFAMDEVERRSIEGRGRPPVAIFLQGASGNIDPRSRGSFEVASDEGSRMGRAGLEALDHAPVEREPEIEVRRIDLDLRLKEIDAKLSAARDFEAQTRLSLENHRGGEGFQLNRLRDHHDQAAQAVAALGFIDNLNRRDRRVDIDRRVMKARVSFARVGNIAIVGLPGEAFVELGLALKANPYFAHTFVTGYCNDLIGYIPTAEAYPRGGYEVESARVGEGTGELIVGRALRELAAMAPTRRGVQAS